MHFFSVIIQPFILIALGFLLSRLRMFPRSLWEGVEKLVYYVLFPPLLFNSVARAELTVSQTSLYLACGVGSMAAGMVLAWIVSKLAPADRLTDASIRQCGYRFNSYIGFAVVLAVFVKILQKNWLGVFLSLKNLSRGFAPTLRYPRIFF